MSYIIIEPLESSWPISCFEDAIFENARIDATQKRKRFLNGLRKSNVLIRKFIFKYVLGCV